MQDIYNLLIPLIVSSLVAISILPRTLLSKFHNRYRFGAVKKGGKTISRARYLGGAAFMPVIIISIAISAIIDMRLMDNHVVSEDLAGQMIKLFQLFGGMSALYLIGLLDDIVGSSAKTRFIVLLFAASLFPLSGLWIDNLYGLMGLHELPAWAGMAFTTILIMYLTETIRLTDGIEGMATGQCSISLLTVLFLSLYAGCYTSGVIASAGLGVTLTFFLMKYRQGKGGNTFLGSCGSMPLGYLICFVILEIYKEKTWFGYGDGLALTAFCTMLIPAWDMLRVLKSRFVDRRDMSLPDRNQLNHKLARMGVGKSVVQALVLLFNLLFIGLSGYLMNKDVNITLILVGDLIIFVLINLTINFFIEQHLKHEHSQEWEKTYGKENWSEEEREDALAELGIEGAALHILQDENLVDNKVHVKGMPKMDLIPFIPDGMNAFERNTKRILDCIGAGLLLLVFSPVFLLCYIVIKMDDGGPAIYRQERIGRFGRPFYIYKFRSMRQDAEKGGPQLSHAGGEADERLTKAGRFLRTHHLDELPQLWNVFCGQMAFIGYRPERLHFIQQIVEYDPRYYMLYQIRPGVTSYATLYNGYTDTMEKMLRRLELDLYYLKHRSWWFDGKILFLTFWHIVGGKRF